MELKLYKQNINSSQLRQCLEDHLTAIFAAKQIDKYLEVDACGPEIQILDNCGGHMTAVSGIKLAYSIWLAMEANDRHSVLCRFHHLYAELDIAGPGKRKTLVFCAIFIHEFAGKLAEAMEWPD